MLNEKQVFEMLGMKRYRRTIIMIPYVAYLKTYYLYNFFRSSITKFDIFMSMIVGFSIDCFTRLVEEGHILTIFDYVRLLKILKNSLYDIVVISRNNPVPFVRVTDIMFVCEELERRNIRGYNRKLFFNYLEENYKSFEGEKFMISTESISKIIDRFVEISIKVKG